jgi:hypothetical protein
VHSRMAGGAEGDQARRIVEARVSWLRVLGINGAQNRLKGGLRGFEFDPCSDGRAIAVRREKTAAAA